MSEGSSVTRTAAGTGDREQHKWRPAPHRRITMAINSESKIPHEQTL